MGCVHKAPPRAPPALMSTHAAPTGSKVKPNPGKWGSRRLHHCKQWSQSHFSLLQESVHSVYWSALESLALKRADWPSHHQLHWNRKKIFFFLSTLGRDRTYGVQITSGERIPYATVTGLWKILINACVIIVNIKTVK